MERSCDFRIDDSPMQTNREPCPSVIPARATDGVNISLAQWEHSPAPASRDGLATGSSLHTTVTGSKARQDLLELDEQLLTARILLQSDLLHGTTIPDSTPYGTAQIEKLAPGTLHLCQPQSALVQTNTSAQATTTTLATAAPPASSALYLSTGSELADVSEPESRVLECMLPGRGASGHLSLLDESCVHVPVTMGTFPDLNANREEVAKCKDGDASFHSTSNRSSSIGVSYTVCTSTADGNTNSRPASNPSSDIGVSYTICASTDSNDGRQQHVDDRIPQAISSECPPSEVYKNGWSFLNNSSVAAMCRGASPEDSHVSELHLPQLASSPDRATSVLTLGDVRLSPIGVQLCHAWAAYIE